MFTAKKVPLPLASVCAKMYLADEPYAAPIIGDAKDFKNVLSIPMQADPGNPLASELTAFIAANQSSIKRQPIFRVS